MGIFIRLSFFFVLISFSHICSALNYSWSYPAVGSFSSGTKSSPQLACTQYLQNVTTTYPGGQPWAYGYVTVSTTSYGCYGHQNSLVDSHRFTGLRSGDGCPSNTAYDSTSGACVELPPVCKVGELFPSKGTTGSVITSSDGRNYVNSMPQVMCKDQCEYSTPDARPSSCYGTPGGEGWCNFIIKSTGLNCSDDNYTLSESGPQLNPPDTPNVPPSTPDDPVCPDGWAVSNGTCFKLPPKFCDPTTGEICAPGTTDPDAPTPDPGTGGTPGTPAEGTEGQPDTSSGADNDLQELEEAKTDAEACKPAADGTGCAGSTVKGEQCDKVVECTGDAVQCAILRQQKKMACAYEYQDARPFIEQQIAKDAYKLPTQSVDGAALFSNGLNAPRWMPQGCPAPKAINITGVSTSLSFEPACDFARALGPIFVVLASIFFAVYVGRAF